MGKCQLWIFVYVLESLIKYSVFSVFRVFYSEGIASRLPAAYFKWRKQPGLKPPPIYSNEPKSEKY